MSNLLHAAGEALYGERWQAPLAETLGINLRTVQRWAAGDGAPNPGHYRDMLEIVEARIEQLRATVGPLRVAAADAQETRPARQIMPMR